jgi:nucleoside 2-deoxyribosyltransferase
MARPRCYVASPLGFSDTGRLYYRQTLLPALRKIVLPVDPWRLTSDAEYKRARRDGTVAELNALAGRRNIEAIRSSELLVAVLDGQELDSGTVAEIGYASGLGLPCFGLRTDRRETGEPDAGVNLQVEAFLRLHGGGLFNTLGDLTKALRKFARQAGTGASGSRSSAASISSSENSGSSRSPAR